MTPGGPADEVGLRPGDIIVDVDGEAAPSVDALIVKTLTMSPRDTLRLTYERQGASHTAVLTPAAGDTQ